MSESNPESAISPSELPVDLVCDLLASEYRSRLLLILRNRGGPVDEATLARSLADETGSADTTSMTTHRMRLHHLHLPKLADAEMISWSPDRETVELTERGDALVTALVAAQHSPSG